MKRIALALALALALVSCEDTIEFRGGETESLVVLNALAESDSTLTARVTLSRFFLSDLPCQELDNAELTLTANGTTHAAYNDGQGNYHFNYTPRPGDTLTIVCQVPGYEPISAGTRVPNRAQLSNPSCSFDPDYFVDNFFDYINGAYRLSFNLKDNADEQNYYRLSIRCDKMFISEVHSYYDTLHHQWAYSDTVLSYDTNITLGGLTYFHLDDIDLVSNDINVGQVLEDGTSFLELFFTDANINGTDHKVKLIVPDESLGSGTAMSKFRVTVESLSREYYLYLLTTRAQEDDWGAGMFSEPTTIQTNIQGGLGILGASSKTILPFE